VRIHYRIILQIFQLNVRRGNSDLLIEIKTPKLKCRKFPVKNVMRNSREKKDYRLRWTANMRWEAVMAEAPEVLAKRYHCSRDHVLRQGRNLRQHKPGGIEEAVVRNLKIFPKILKMMNEAKYELLVAVAYVKDCDEIISAMVRAAQRGVEVRFLFHPDSWDLSMIDRLREARVDFRHLKYLHGKLVITDSTAMESSLNFTPTCVNRNFQFARFDTNHEIVHAYRELFYEVFKLSKKQI